MNALDYSDVDTTNNTPRERWEAMITAIEAGQLIQISEDVYTYFLEVLPPRGYFPGGFYFCEGYDRYTRFYRTAGQCYAHKQQ